MLRIPLRSSFLTLQFDNLEDRDAIVDTLTPLVQQVQNKGKQPVISDQFSGPPALVAIKKKLLSSDRSAKSADAHVIHSSQGQKPLRHQAFDSVPASVLPRMFANEQLPVVQVRRGAVATTPVVAESKWCKSCEQDYYAGLLTRPSAQTFAST